MPDCFPPSHFSSPLKLVKLVRYVMFSSYETRVKSAELQASGPVAQGSREEAGLTQQELARRLHIKYYAFVSRVETGLSRVPTDKLEVWAQTLDVDPTEFAKHLISFYEPQLHRLLYQVRSRRAHPSTRRSRIRTPG
jgi:transcriptional regulator with XRE-family HTH domain